MRTFCTFRACLLGGVLALLATASSAAADESQWNENELLDLLIRKIDDTADSGVQASLLRGLLQGLEGRRDVNPPAGWRSLRQRLSESRNEQVRDAARLLSQRFGDQAAIEQAMTVAFDSSAAVDRRREALAALVAQRYRPVAPRLVELLEVPQLRIDAVRAFGVLDVSTAPQELLGRYADVPAPVRRAIIETLASRKSYASELTRALGKGIVSRDEIPSYVARSLADIVGQPFTDVYGPIQEMGGDVGAAISKYKQILTKDALAGADASRGRVVFQKTCAACHLMYGDGGTVGPDLTGSNRANLDYLLLNSVAPSADVPEGYRTRLVQTIDGRILTGVLAAEDDQRIILKTVEQPRLVVAKADIEARKVSEKSMMPEGQLDQLSRRDLLDLVKYMQTKAQVEPAK